VVEKGFAWGPVRFVQCATCGSMVQSPQITTDSLAAWYDSREYQTARDGKEGAYLDYLTEEKQRQREAVARFERDLAPRLSTPARVLEVGCATGSLLAVIRNAGHEVQGIELSATFAESARQLNDLDILVTDFAQYQNEPACFDLIIMLGTLSNLPEFARDLALVRKLLAAGGLFYFNVPVVSSLMAKLYGSSYWMYAPSVSNFLSLEGMNRALANAGLRVVKQRTDRQRPTIGKLLGHGKLHRLFPWFRRMGLSQRQFPTSLPIPGVVVVWATTEESSWSN